MTFPDFLTLLELKETRSTNSYLKGNLPRLRDKFPVMVTTESQTSGRGRQKRRWISRGKLGLASSFGISYPRLDRLNFLPLIAGISVIELLTLATGKKFVLKWPNDVLYQNLKIAGVLIENSVYQDGIISIVGIGINVNYTQIDFDRDFPLKATSMRIICDRSYSIRELNMRLADGFFKWLKVLDSSREKKIIETCRAYCSAYTGRDIAFHTDQEKVQGKFVGISSDGGLILEINGAVKTFYSGEIISSREFESR
jgi:BirA family biotin operon repressor/biotin-[acetyl-CoA-carboxylase] ligase